MPEPLFLMRSYPAISDLIRDITGLDLPLPIFSFGFFVALAFLVGAFVLAQELKRKEKEGLLQSFTRHVTTGLPATRIELFGQALLGFVAGYKVLAIILNYQEFAAAPQEFIVSSDGNWLGGIGLAALLAWLRYRSKDKKKLAKPVTNTVQVYPHETVGDIVLVTAISGILGAKLFYLFEAPGNFTAFLKDPLGGFFGGLTIYGGLIMGTIAGIYFARKRHINVFHLADAAAPAMLLAYGVGRIGCQVSGDGDWGIVNTAPKPGWLSWLPDWLWAFDYPHNVNNEGVLMEACKELHCYVLPQPVFPTPIYETFMAVVLFGILWAFRKRISIPGMMFALYLIVNGIERFTIEQIRVNTKLEIFGIQATQAELVAILFILSGIGFGYYCYRKFRSEKG